MVEHSYGTMRLLLTGLMPLLMDESLHTKVRSVLSELSKELVIIIGHSVIPYGEEFLLTCPIHSNHSHRIAL